MGNNPLHVGELYHDGAYRPRNAFKFNYDACTSDQGQMNCPKTEFGIKKILRCVIIHFKHISLTQACLLQSVISYWYDGCLLLFVTGSKSNLGHKYELLYYDVF